MRHSALRSMKILETRKVEKKHEKKLGREDKEQGKGKKRRITWVSCGQNFDTFQSPEKKQSEIQFFQEKISSST